MLLSTETVNRRIYYIIPLVPPTSGGVHIVLNTLCIPYRDMVYNIVRLCKNMEHVDEILGDILYNVKPGELYNTGIKVDDDKYYYLIWFNFDEFFKNEINYIFILNFNIINTMINYIIPELFILYNDHKNDYTNK
jgi:hypothetical protein